MSLIYGTRTQKWDQSVSCLQSVLRTADQHVRIEGSYERLIAFWTTVTSEWIQLSTAYANRPWFSFYRMRTSNFCSTQIIWMDHTRNPHFKVAEHGRRKASASQYREGASRPPESASESGRLNSSPWLIQLGRSESMPSNLQRSQERQVQNINVIQKQIYSSDF